MTKIIIGALAIIGILWVLALVQSADAHHCKTQTNVSYENCMYTLTR